MFIINITELAIFIFILLSLLITYLIFVIKNWLGNIKNKNKMERNKKMAIKIIYEFENLLSNYNMKIPSEERIGSEDEACIYGIQYYDLEDAIIDILSGRG